MQEVIAFAIMVIAISASGVMSPGPLFSANVIYGLKEGRIAGLKIAIGHTIVEFPLIVLLGAGISFPLMILIHFFEGFLETKNFGIETTIFICHLSELHF